jgi:hypothetical protein
MNRKERRMRKLNPQQIQFVKVENMLAQSLPGWYQSALQKKWLVWAIRWMCRVELQQRPQRNVYTCYFLGKEMGETSVNHV